MVGKNSFEITTVMKLKTTKSYHSSALPITAATTARVFGVLLKAREPLELPDLTIAMSPSPAGVSDALGYVADVEAAAFRRVRPDALASVKRAEIVFKRR